MLELVTNVPPPAGFVAVAALPDVDEDVAALPEMLIPQVPDAPVPVNDGMSVPIARPKFVRAVAADVAPVPPAPTPKVDDKLPALPVVFWFKVGTSPAWMADITTFVPFPRRYWPDVVA